MGASKVKDSAVHHLVGNLEDFPLHLGKTVHIGETEIAVFRISEDTLYALENKTGHKKGGPLTEGIVSGEYVYCPLHDCKVNLRTGEVQLPDTGQVKTFPVSLEGNKVLIIHASHPQ
ncbi:nitrite reductase small subunit NirD [Paenibacillus sp. GCM10027628]|uniref:nitrite reductase small subunit NirD n=1 Tax=Paenibacillus sp. GCM10027628 TaxID=3273413 RepID=UPI00362CFF95